jgi:sphinganine-1-phosphate aldolase
MYSFCLDWSGGIYATPTTAGSRPGGVIAATWAALVSIGHAGYVEIVDSIVKAREAIVRETRSIPGLEIVGNPQAMVIAYRTDGSFSIYDVLDHMSTAGYSLNGLQHPSAIHLCLTKLHTSKEFQDRFAADLRRAVEKAKIEGGKEGGMAPIYGQAASVPDPSLLEGAVGAYLDATLDATI